MYERIDVSEGIRTVNNNSYYDEKYITIKFHSDEDLNLKVTRITWPNNNC